MCRTHLFFVDHVARDLGFGLAIGGWIWVAAGITAVLAPMVAGVAADRFGYGPVLRIIVALMAIGAALPALTHNLVLLTLSAMMAGGLMIGLGSSTSGRTARSSDRRRIRRPGRCRRSPSPSSRPALPTASPPCSLPHGSHALVFALAGTIIAAGLATELVTARMAPPPG